ncbi:MAG TPA: hypothetical protein ENK91_16970 [Bacteroidetes bacterium]|nr:hypothetical protein [Bacteroidota bacterium]
MNSGKASSNTLKKQDACEVLSKEEVSSLLKVDINDLTQEDMSFAENERRSICHYVVKNGEIGSYNIRLSWKSDKAKANKVLEKSYSRYLSSGEKNMDSYEELDNSNGTQILFGTQKEDHGTTNYIIRKRFGNSAEVKIEVLTQNEAKELKSKLLKIINEL